MRPYKVLEPGATYEQPTFSSHPWTFETARAKEKGKARRCVTASGAPLHIVMKEQDDAFDEWNEVYVSKREIEIHKPTIEQTWTPETHAEFNPAFRSAAKAFLLAHNRLAHENEPGLGTIPSHLAVEIIRRASPRVAQYKAIAVNSIDAQASTMNIRF